MPVFISHRHSDTQQALQISRFLKENGIESYLDVLDAESQQTNDITTVITKNIAKCTHLIAVMSEDTARSWWVPFEIGEATIIDRRIASYRIGYSKLPEYLEQWPQMTSPLHLQSFVRAYKEDTRQTASARIFESRGSSSGEKSRADAFHRDLKHKIKFS
ncbi:toll/interleukin-1 receptor domain-containing protein [Photobacterium swingsii]|uniref:toll/interleukin-1 receptor domain-containing protein n=1 Tax=Photobacterium swingsii TaxID=680026 RepID=UPI0040679D2F